MRNNTLVRCTAITAALLAIVAFAAPTSASAASGWASMENTQKSSSLSYWTPEMIRSARPLPLPKISANAVAGNEIEADAAVEANGTPTGADGAPPRYKVPANLVTRDADYDAGEIAAARAALEEYDAIEGDNFGTLNGQFSSSRVFPDAATTAYPYLTVGKLFFTIPGQGNFICSGSVIKKRVILTAGHCVHSGNGQQNGFYSNFLFIPAYRNNVRPAGTWDWNYVAVTGTWFSGGASFPNAADYAMIEPKDLSGNLLGNVTGFLGFQTLKLFPNHAHLLGYPANLDSGERMHQVTAQSLRKTNPNAVEYGSDMRGGSSGGPWVQNFGVVSSGQTGGSNTGSNRVIGITSYGFVSTTPLIQGSSVPDSRFTNLLNTICAHRSGNC
ncbi:MAG TPA: trypsin-like serine protease [Thermoanaerobaculia bacterium]|jgi:V8-like Glu-specific endopeptidase|nr:trypsin-like serine protease [Thermoanaerobaculia bacterium]